MAAITRPAGEPPALIGADWNTEWADRIPVGSAWRLYEPADPYVGVDWFADLIYQCQWDYDEQGIHLLVDSPFLGEDRQQVVHFGRNGFFYQVDRTNGAYMNETQYVQSITWTAAAKLGVWQALSTRAGGEVISSDSY